MNKTQVIELINKQIRNSNFTTPLDELKIILRLLEENPLREEHKSINEFIPHLKGIISLQNEKLNQRTQRQFDECYN